MDEVYRTVIRGNETTFILPTTKKPKTNFSLGDMITVRMLRTAQITLFIHDGFITSMHVDLAVLRIPLHDHTYLFFIAPISTRKTL